MGASGGAAANREHRICALATASSRAGEAVANVPPSRRCCGTECQPPPLTCWHCFSGRDETTRRVIGLDDEQTSGRRYAGLRLLLSFPLIGVVAVGVGVDDAPERGGSENRHDAVRGSRSQWIHAQVGVSE